MTRQRQVTPDVEQEVSHAVERFSSSFRDQPASSAREGVQYYQQPKHGRALLWAGVLSVTLFVLGLWIWNTRVVLVDAFTSSSTAEDTLFSNVQNDFSHVVASLFEEETRAATATATSSDNGGEDTSSTIALKAALAAVLQASSTTPTSTDNALE